MSRRRGWRTCERCKVQQQRINFTWTVRDRARMERLLGVPSLPASVFELVMIDGVCVRCRLAESRS